MNYLLNLPLKTQLAIGSSAAVVVAILIGTFLAYWKLETMESLLNKCRLVAVHSRFWGNSPRGRMIRLCAVHVAIALPQWNVRRGAIDLQQVQTFPRGLNFIFLGMSLIGMAGVLGWIVLYFVVI